MSQYTIADVAKLLCATEVEIRSLLKDRSLKSLRWRDVEKFRRKLNAFFVSLEGQLAQVEKQVRVYCLGRRIFQTELVDVANDGAIDALLRCIERWKEKKPVRPERYLARAVHVGIGSALKDHFDAYQNEFTHDELPEEIEDRRERSTEDPLDYCRTEREYDVMACLKDGLTYDEIETETGIDRSTVGRVRADIQDRYTRLCA